jgi:hypothetical protein
MFIVFRYILDLGFGRECPGSVVAVTLVFSKCLVEVFQMLRQM